MTDVTYYVVLPFGAGDDGPEPREAVECTSVNAAIRSAERMERSEGHSRRALPLHWSEVGRRSAPRRGKMRLR
jgi:hypothetical protein